MPVISHGDGIRLFDQSGKAAQADALVDTLSLALEDFEP
jgi:hypothetical protein